MAELTTIKLNPDSHLLLDQSILRLPLELMRKNFRLCQRAVEREREQVMATLRTTANESMSGARTPHETLGALDGMMQRMQGLKRKLESLRHEEQTIHGHTRSRIQHLQDLYDIPSLADVKYEAWSRVRLDRLLVDYLLRSGFEESAGALAREKGIEPLVDLEVFRVCNRLQDSLRHGRTHECLAWCAENKPGLRKMNSDLEFHLRLQQYIELVRTGERAKLLEATHHARKYLSPHRDSHAEWIHQAAGLLAFAPDTATEPYQSMYAASRWEFLAQVFLSTHHALFSLPAQPLLYVALSAGLSSLKTPACHGPSPIAIFSHGHGHGHPVPHGHGHPVPHVQGHPVPHVQGHPVPHVQGHPVHHGHGHPVHHGHGHPVHHGHGHGHGVPHPLANIHLPHDYNSQSHPNSHSSSSSSQHLTSRSQLLQAERARIRFLHGGSAGAGPLSSSSAFFTNPLHPHQAHVVDENHPPPHPFSLLPPLRVPLVPAAARAGAGAGASASVCPICSTELNELARYVPYAHHTKSHVEHDPVVLPNGRIYGRKRLLDVTAQAGLPPGQVKDPVTSEVFDQAVVRKVYIS
ncbi:MAG: GID complex subunit containing RING finger motif [Phylliscum demangeonii]|nr:MAG: GID complex subunit containing RING finger motif [Phylliscum demangeonii]